MIYGLSGIANPVREQMIKGKVQAFVSLEHRRCLHHAPEALANANSSRAM